MYAGYNLDVFAVQDRFTVSFETAENILYLRSRSRWTLEKEEELIRRDREGNPIKSVTVLSGEF